MRNRFAGWLMMGTALTAWPVAAHADYLASARTAMQQGDLKAAQIDLRNAVRADPQNPEPHYWLGRVSFELGDPVAAEREAVAARDRGFDPHQTVPLLSQSLLAQDKFDQLLDTLKPDGKDHLLDASILVSRGYALVGLKRPDDARKAFADAEQAAPDAVEPLLADARLAVGRGDLATAQGKLQQALAAQPKSVEVRLAEAQLRRLQNDPAGALAVLDGLIADQAGSVQARLDRATLELGTGKVDAGKADIDFVLKGTPGNVQAIYLRAVLQTQQKNYRAADADLERISGFLGRIQRAYYLQAVVKEQLGQTEQAEDAARKYLGRAPNDLAAYKVLARIQLARHRSDQVIDTLGKLAESGQGDAESFDLLGRAYATTGRGAEAIGAFQKAQALAPNDVGLQTRLASVRMGMGDADAAMGDLEHTLTLAPKLPAVGEALFFAALATGDVSKAADALAQIRAAEGQTDIVGNLEGLFKLSQIDLDGARARFREVVKTYPDFVPAKVNLARVDLMFGDRDQAVSLLSGILAKQPAAEPALTMLVSTDVQADQAPAAIAALEQAHRAEPGQSRVTAALGAMYIRAGDAQKALDLTAAGSAGAAPPLDLLGLRGAAYLALGQKKAAREAYEAILKQDPNVVGARRQIVAMLLESNDYEAARNLITAGIAANPRNYQLYQDFVLIDLRAGGIETALATAVRLQNQDRDFAAIRALQGDVYMAANRPADAVTAYAAANTAAPSSLLVTRTAGAMLRVQRADDARRLLADWVGQHPDDLVVTEQLADLSIAADRLDDAAKALQQLLQHKPHDAVALNNLAWVYQQQGDTTRAQSLARQAYVLSPGPQTADTLGWILTSTGKSGDGVALLRQASAATGVDPRILFHYAVALKDTGNRAEAKKQLETVVAAKGDFKEKPEAQKLLDDLSQGG